MLNRATKAKPRGQRNSPRASRWNVAEIESNHSEAIALQQQVGDFQHLRELRLPAAKAESVFSGGLCGRGALSRPDGAEPRHHTSFSASHPQQTAHLHAGCRRRRWIEGIAGIDERTNFSALRGLGEREKQYAGSAR